jgi:hypothetical protein
VTPYPHFWFSRAEGEVRWTLWLRFTALLLIFSVVGLVEGALLSPFGFGYFVIVLTITLYAVKKFAPRMFGNRDFAGSL